MELFRVIMSIEDPEAREKYEKFLKEQANQDQIVKETQKQMGKSNYKTPPGGIPSAATGAPQPQISEYDVQFDPAEQIVVFIAVNPEFGIASSMKAAYIALTKTISEDPSDWENYSVWINSIDHLGSVYVEEPEEEKLEEPVFEESPATSSLEQIPDPIEENNEIADSADDKKHDFRRGY